MIVKEEKVTRQKTKILTHNNDKVLLEAIIETLPIGIFLADANGRIYKTNEIVKDIWGMNAVMANNSYEYEEYNCWWADSGEKLKAHDWALAKAIKKKERSIGEIINIINFEGKRKTIISGASPILNYQGVLIGVVATNQDITYQKTLEKELRKHRDNSERLVAIGTVDIRKEILKREKAQWELESIFNYSQDLICTVGLDKCFKKVNPAFTKILGFSEEELLGKSFIDFVHPDDRAKTNLTLLELTQKGKTSLFQNRYICKDGSNKWLEWDATANKEKTVFFGIARDITDRIKSHNEAQLLAAIVASTYDAIIGKDLNENIISWNSSAEKIFGFSKEEALGQHISLIFPENIKNDVPIQAVLSEDIKAYRIVRRRKNGELVNVAVTISPLRDDMGEVVGEAAIYRDITEKVSYEKELKKLDCLNIIGQMAAGIAHEIRNPMTTIRGFLQLMLRKEDMKHKDYLTVAINELDRVNEIISEFLSIAKNRPIDFQNKNLNDLVKAILPLLQSTAILDDKSINISLGDIPEINIDEAEIRQLIINIVKNGLEAMTANGMIEIKTYLGNDDKVILSIADQGTGIAPEILENIGTPFLTTKKNGTGLGLAICYQIAARHNAEIKINSNKNGTEFIIEFPVAFE